jgi:multidrug resistance efflux pump
MTNTQAASEAAAPKSAKPAPAENPVKRITLIVAGIGLFLFLYGIIADRVTPYTSQALVQSYLVRIGPEVAGKVSEVSVRTDQRVAAGAVLFKLDPEQFALAVKRAEAQLELAGQNIGASTASVATAQAKVAEAVAKRQNAREQTARTIELIDKGVYPEARRAQATAALESAEAVVAQAEAELEKARQNLGAKGLDNPQVRDAMAALAQANLDLQRTTVLAPSDGGVTNLSLAVGQVLSKGEAAMTYIDIREIWIEAVYRENSLESIAVGNPVEIVLDIRPGRVISGRVTALGYGVSNRNIDPRTGLLSPKAQSGWIRPPQLMPVRIELDEEIRPLRYGSQASVMVYPTRNFVMNFIALVKMRVIALLTYVQ